MRTSTVPFTIATLLLSACPGGPYEPCQSVDDCDIVTTDACVQISGKPGKVCTMVCKTASECPEGPEGERPICAAVGQVSMASVCTLP